jgi:RNA polymerase sigma-70 factor (ECF subfamily)
MTGVPKQSGRDDDNRLVALALAGDVAAFTALIKGNENKVYRFILKFLNSSADARDLTQETLLQAYLCLASFNGASRFSTWLIGIALNLARNHVSRAPKFRFIEYNEEIMPDTNTLDNPSLKYQQRAMLGELVCAIQALPAALRESMLLIGLEGHSYEEAAQLQNLPLGTVKSQVSRARQLLRQKLALRGLFD